MASESSTSPPLNIKLLLIGNSSVGKSSLLLRFADETWLNEDESSATIGVDFRVSKMEVNGRRVKLSIWVSALDVVIVWMLMRRGVGVACLVRCGVLAFLVGVHRTQYAWH